MNVNFKNYEKKYFNDCCKLIEQNWDFCNHFIAIKDRNYTFELYFKKILLECSYKKIVINEKNELLAMIFAEEKKNNKFLIKFFDFKVFVHLILGHFGKRIKALSFFIKYVKTCNKLYKQTSFDKEILLLAVSKKSRGLGLGKSLITQYLAEMKIKNYKKIGLQTGSDCDYSFYDYLSFKREASLYTDMYEKGREKENFFIYVYYL